MSQAPKPNKPDSKNNQLNKHRLRRRAVSRIYWKTIVVSFIASFILALIGGALHLNMGAGFMQILLIICVMPASLALVCLLPYICYMVYLTRRANIFDKFVAEQEAKDVTKPDGPAPLQQIVYIGHEGKTYGPMGAAMVLLFLLPPIGLYFVLMKSFTDQRHYLENAVTLETVGKVLTVAGVLITAFNYYLWREAGSLPLMAYIICAMPLFSGLVMYFLSKYLHKKGAHIALCQNLVAVQGILSLQELSHKLSFSYEETIRVLQRYINKGFLFASFIDFKEHKVVVPLKYPKIAVKCKNCGGTTVKLNGISSVCSYCGRKI
ncbi:MAG: hypothetical protein KBS83_08865 [Lachnospiraceae bacterium]|nr:hypothetical protein [Candidatus Equihabitans merdae]